ncbi:unnamed protein product [Hermetia illucens]|uniref:Sulfhydryl oxidase n=2 Tax=Hermetia illucens TaxID=343691 RepID=A0A7R8UCZ4_HERIL|nr:unnamed protein product [Hermetia illucens]
MKLLVSLAFFSICVTRSDSGLPFHRPVSDSEYPGLYDATDKVVILTARNIEEVVPNKNYATLLQFYNSFCGHCRRFAPKYKQLGANLHAWRDVVQVAALDCSTDENNDVCRKYEIMGYPSLRYFGPHYVVGEKSLGDPIQSQDLDVIADVVARNIMLQAPQEPQWPNFANLEDDNPQNLFKNEPDTLKYAIIIFEPENSTVGAQTILNFHQVKAVKIRRTTNAEVAKKMGIETFNTIKILQRSSDSMSISLPNASSSTVKIAIDKFLQDKHLVEGQNDTNKSTKTSVDDHGTLADILKQPRHTIYQADMEHALRYTIFHEIPAKATISGEKLLAVQRYLAVLSRYNPLGENGRRFVDEMKNFAYSQNESLDGKKFQETALEYEKSLGPIFSSSKWIGCIASKPGYRGYTCGLWTLFHSMTVQAAEDETATDPLEVLQAMHGYIKNFFGCTDCAAHFQSMAARLKMWNVTSKDDAVLWLWNAHNQVNKRLAGDPTEDPAFPKIQFPSINSCPACRHEHSTKHSNDIDWDKVEVLQFLKNIHNPQNISRYGVDDESVLPETPAKMRSKRMIGSVFSDMDMRMGIFLYIFCVGMMFVAVKLFLRKGYRKKPYMHGMLGKV